MELTLKEYLIKFFDAKESFFENGIKCKVDFKGASLGFVSSSLFSKISIGKSFIPLEKVFPSKKKFILVISCTQINVGCVNLLRQMELLKKQL